jgi:protein-tyrosine-phosphatase
MIARTHNVLFLCAGNAGQSQIAAVLLNRRGRGRFKGFSAGSAPADRPNPYAHELLETQGLATPDLRSTSWDEFARPSAPKMDFVITVCDRAAASGWPECPGNPVTAHWSIPDPNAVKGSHAERRHAFRAAYQSLDRMIAQFVGLPPEELGRIRRKRWVEEFARARNERAPAPRTMSAL